jgi:hypothetical protein
VVSTEVVSTFSPVCQEFSSGISIAAGAVSISVVSGIVKMD